jgi:surface polysaccharide O-acyltransferase-like enzyme
MKKFPYRVQADILRILAIVGVVLVHIVYEFYARPDFLGGTTWWIANVLSGVSHSAVPLFIMLSGALLLRRTQNAKQLWQRIFHRLLIPMLFWLVFYLLWHLRFDPPQPTIIQFLGMIATGNIYELYFLVILVGLYTLIPVLQAYVLPSRSRTKLVILITALAGGVTYFAPYFWTGGILPVTAFTLCIPYISYFLLGDLLAQRPFSLRPFAILAVIGVVGIAALGYMNVYLRGRGITPFWIGGLSYFDEYFSPNTFLLSVALFPLMYHADWLANLAKSAKVVSAIRLLATASFAVYLVHSAVTETIEQQFGYRLGNNHGNLLEFFMLHTLLILTVSFILAILGVSIPYVRAVFGISEK